MRHRWGVAVPFMAIRVPFQFAVGVGCGANPLGLSLPDRPDESAQPGLCRGGGRPSSTSIPAAGWRRESGTLCARDVQPAHKRRDRALRPGTRAPPAVGPDNRGVSAGGAADPGSARRSDRSVPRLDRWRRSRCMGQPPSDAGSSPAPCASVPQELTPVSRGGQ
jgi:hypothetical protein